MLDPIVLQTPSETKQPSVKNALSYPAFFKAVDSDFTAICYTEQDAFKMRRNPQWVQISSFYYYSLDQMEVK